MLNSVVKLVSNKPLNENMSSEYFIPLIEPIIEETNIPVNDERNHAESKAIAKNLFRYFFSKQKSFR